MSRLFLICFASIMCAVHADAPKTPRPELALQIGHSSGVANVALSPDNTMVASAEFDQGSIVLWDARTGDVLRRIREPGLSFVWGLRFSSDGALLAAAMSNGIKLRSTRSGEVVRFLPGNPLGSVEIAFSPDGRFLAANAYDYQQRQQVQLWDLQSGEIARKFLLGGTGTCAVAFTPDGKTVFALRPEDNLLRAWDVATGEPQPPVPVDSKGGGNLTFSGDASTFAFARTVGNVPEIVVCDTRTGKMIRTIRQANKNVSKLALSPDGSLLATAPFNRTLELWNSRSGELVQTINTTGEDRLISAAFSPDGKSLVAGASSSVLLYDVSTPAKPRLARTLRGRGDFMVGVAFAPDGGAIYSESISQQENDPHLREWDAKTGVLRRTQRETSLTLVNPGGLSPDGTIRASGFLGLMGEGDGDAKLRDAKTGAVLRTLKNSQGVISVAFINGGKTIVGGTFGRGLRVWDAATGELKQTIKPTGAMPESGTLIAVSPNGKLLASIEMPGNISLWNAGREPLKEPLRVIKMGEAPSLFTALTFSPDSATLAAARLGDTLLLDANTGQKIRSFQEHGGYVFAMAFSSDGKRLATAGDNTVKVWNPSNGRLLATLYNFPPDEKNGTEDYLVITPEGYYSGSAAADRHVRFRLGDTLYPAESFQARYYRPDLVQKALAGEELPPVGEFKGPFPPVSKLGLAPTDKSSRDNVTVALTATDDSAIKSVAFFVNGARVDAKPLTAESRPLTAESRALTAESKALTAESRSIPAAHKTLTRYTAVLPLPQGATNIKIQAIAFDDDGLQSPREELIFSREASAAPQGKLLGLCVGVSHYQDARLNLKFADADANALAKTLGAQRGIYNDANITALTNEKATALEVKSQLDTLIQASTRADTVMLSLSGHGWRDDARNFYFATHEVNRNDVAKTALPWKDITDRLTQLSQRSKRVVVLLDACHSGSAATNEELVKAILSANAGVLVFASSRGSEVSLENAEWGHGAFTKALLEAIEGKAAPAGETKVTMLDFIAYVSRRVKNLTQDQQHPQVPFLQDFDTDAALVAKP